MKLRIKTMKKRMAKKQKRFTRRITNIIDRLFPGLLEPKLLRCVRTRNGNLLIFN